MNDTNLPIVVAGCGFAGLTAALHLEKAFRRNPSIARKIILVDRFHHQLYTPALYEIASIPEGSATDPYLKSSVLISIVDIIQGRGIDFICDEIVNISAAEKKLMLKNTGELAYEYLILALGSETNYFNIPGLVDYGHPLKTFNDGVRLRHSIENLFKKGGQVAIVVGGGGSSGVELVAEFVNFICALEKTNSRHVCAVHFVMVERSPEILPGFDKRVVKKTRTRLEELGIEILTGCAIVKTTASEIFFDDGNKQAYDILIWTGGVKGPSLFLRSGLPLSDKGSVLVDEYLHPSGNTYIFAIGDNATCMHPQTGKPLNWNVPVAEAEGKAVAENILLTLRGIPPQRFTPRKHYPFILAVGKKYAVADFSFAVISGFSGWVIKQLVELRYLFSILPTKKALKVWLRSMKSFVSND